MGNLTEKIYEAFDSKKCKGLLMLSQEFNETELNIVKHLKPCCARLLGSESFDKVWEFLTTFEKLTFFIEKSGCIFEPSVVVAQGKDSNGYFNLFTEGTLHGHLKKENITNIALLNIPFMNLKSYQVAFFDKDGNTIFSLYLGRFNHKHREEDINRFMDFFNNN